MQDVEKILKASVMAARRHADQKRKGISGVPYINHPLEVAEALIRVGGVDDVDTLIAALLHDTVEDTATTPAEIREIFGERVAAIVAEVTDDKMLPKARRKELQVEHAPHLSDAAKQLKLADKIVNIRDITNDPPADWDRGRCIGYVDWGEQVAAGLRGVNRPLEDLFDETVAAARAKFA